MKIDVVVIKDVNTSSFTGFVRKFPGVCAQADDIESLKHKIETYMDRFVKEKLIPALDKLEYEETVI